MSVLSTCDVSHTLGSDSGNMPNEPLGDWYRDRAAYCTVTASSTWGQIDEVGTQNTFLDMEYIRLAPYNVEMTKYDIGLLI